MDVVTPLSAYRQSIELRGFQPDEAQYRAVLDLQACHEALHPPGTESIQGVYLWGPVGRGKTWLMDSFHQSLRVPARRQHFHRFMQWLHTRLFQLGGTADPLRALARELAREVRVLCFDELFVSDIGDAILLGTLMQTLFEEGVVMVATSNQPPRELYADGFNRERFLPAVAALERHMKIVAVDGDQDHRLHPGQPLQRYWVARPGEPSALLAVFERLNAGGPFSTHPVAVGPRAIDTVRLGESLLWCRFDALCGQPLAARDFIALCDRFAAILIGDVPRLGGPQYEARIARGTEDAASQVITGDRQLPALARNDDSVRRFIALVDECYDRRVPLYVEAAVPMPALYTEGYLDFAFRRTLSRLQEMQWQRFGAAPPSGA